MFLYEELHESCAHESDFKESLQLENRTRAALKKAHLTSQVFGTRGACLGFRQWVLVIVYALGYGGREFFVQRRD